jgi:anti-sigma regulatory factor (Ser/Thr protein kinase)
VSSVADPSVVELEIPPGSAYVAIVRLAIAALARGAGLDEEAVEEFKLALSEACTNAVLVHEESSIQEPVEVRWIEEADRLIVEVLDRGPSPGPEKEADQFDSQGFSSRMLMSRVLLAALADGCEFLPRAGGGTVARLVLHRERPSS